MSYVEVRSRYSHSLSGPAGRGAGLRNGAPPVKDTRILIVEDEEDIAELMSYNLGKEGFAVSITHDGREALDKIRNDKPDLVVLDLMLPGIHGTEVCRALRRDPETDRIPIVMVTARGEEVDRVLGLEIGADDYITKPFSPREFVARVKAVLRRSSGSSEKEKVISIGDLVINTGTYTVTKRGQPLGLSAKEFRILLYMVERRGRIFSRDQLLDAVWKDEAFVEPRTVDVHIRRLRTQIEDDPSTPVYVRTRRGIGYYVDRDL